ncbi:hypothetical protein THAOC_04264 [Thalassiosira oceanica]|uniref:Uncharacterized protein n=1 Tax=Thalassiosira oceanica TaxID=159749 RepID=K0TP26_THAOC|nr:hypothetical protein THAOC_04264 [Thalassiosira oceanica]|eukprot:EJK74082.1 hypothetical protein THAOC_04264 [Thalassiosira oceanica]
MYKPAANRCEGSIVYDGGPSTAVVYLGLPSRPLALRPRNGLYILTGLFPRICLPQPPHPSPLASLAPPPLATRPAGGGRGVCRLYLSLPGHYLNLSLYKSQGPFQRGAKRSLHKLVYTSLRVRCCPMVPR